MAANWRAVTPEGVDCPASQKRAKSQEGAPEETSAACVTCAGIMAGKLHNKNWIHNCRSFNPIIYFTFIPLSTIAYAVLMSPKEDETAA